MVHLVGKRQSWEFSCWARWNQNGWIVGANYLWLGCIQPGSVDLFSKFSLIFTKLITLPPSLIYLFLHESIFRGKERKTNFLFRGTSSTATIVLPLTIFIWIEITFATIFKLIIHLAGPIWRLASRLLTSPRLIPWILISIYHRLIVPYPVYRVAEVVQTLDSDEHFKP